LIFQLNLLSNLHHLSMFSLFLPNHHQPTHPSSSTTVLSTINLLIFVLSCPCWWHPLLPHAVRTRSQLKLEFLWVKFLVKVNYAPALYWKLLTCPWWHLCGMFCLSGQDNRRQGPILLTVEKCWDFKNIYWNVRTILQSHAKYKDQNHI